MEMMPGIVQAASPVTVPWTGQAARGPYADRAEVIDRLSRAPVKVRHWLLTHETFRAGLDSLDPDNLAWVQDARIRLLVKNGLMSMADSAVAFARAFPDAVLPGV